MVNATNSTYNLLPSSTQNDLLGFITTVNNLTDQVFMTGILLVSFVIFFVALQRFGAEDALLASGFITSVMTVLFAALDLIPPLVLIIILIAYGAYFTVRMVNR